MLNFKVNIAADKAEILLYDVIGEDFFGGISAKMFSEELARAKAAKQIDVRINSPGGDAFAAFTMYNLLKNHAANVSVFIDGLAASAASIVAMAGDEIEIAANGMIMIHRAWTAMGGNAEDFRKQADVLDKVDANISETYASRTGGDIKGIQEQMAAETWLNATEAVDQGFADRVGMEHAIAACIRPRLFNYKHAPPQFVEDVAEEMAPEPTIPFHQLLKQEISQFERTLPHVRRA